MNSMEIRQKYVDFFKQRGHVQVPSSQLVLNNDPTTLFVSSGMQPLVPYLLGDSHPSGNKLVNSQICLRAQGFLDDFMEVGDNRHTTFFEMLGNWSLGSYFKQEQLAWFFEFLTAELNLNPQKLYISVFSGDTDSKIPKDIESAEIWKKLFEDKGITDVRVFYYGVKKNWWSKSGLPKDMPSGEPGGPDSEVFYDFETPHDKRFGEECHPNCDCGRFLEIGNSVFMQYVKNADGTFSNLPQKNVDFGGGLERLTAAVLNNSDIFNTDLYKPLISKISKVSGKEYIKENKPYMRVIADHLKGAVFLISNGVIPSNKMQGYVLRKYLRRSAVKMQLLCSKTLPSSDYTEIAEQVFEIYKDIPDNFGFNLHSEAKQKVSEVISEELTKFGKTIKKGLKEFNKVSPKDIDGKFAFNLFQTYGFPFEITNDLLNNKGFSLNKEEFTKEFQKHQEKS
ncbi:hypothetical protein A3H26_01260 [candidate division WWE3 bacterium RIFCSPLOWO2_12_FULL_36_10]|uniref:alanine--tRNA ligase n=1 Tax=candidate division WWE3 bacterium RIFCSPLOWO2_12_FULL_36_10 TaxID=1802630 RepID=A0A1F4VK23_UNCKA|nr:MAG: hypothetical protein A3H26_01260 [candidate division WWE3 bacterium RIFCSPLOWO2_12_FULL_36_10]